MRRIRAGGPQGTTARRPRSGRSRAAQNGEDCLTLNVCTPARPARGGRCSSGSTAARSSSAAAAPLYDGARLAARGDVVVVTVNYASVRSGSLARGRAPATPARGEPRPARSDRGVAVGARERRRFGGDPEHVTMFGESAGAVSGGELLAMPAARGLFGARSRRARRRAGTRTNRKPRSGWRRRSRASWARGRAAAQRSARGAGRGDARRAVRT